MLKELDECELVHIFTLKTTTGSFKGQVTPSSNRRSPGVARLSEGPHTM